jgi:iron complex outermembrane receptor protein
MRSLVAGIAAGCCISVCFAQEPQEDAVIVTAPRFPDEVRRLPASVTVITADDIAKSAARTIPELLNEQVGFTMKDLFGNNASQTSIDLRGFGVTGPQNTLILLDGRRLNDFDLSGVQWSAIPLASIERIEILRGTGAVLYGDNASAGVVNIVSRSPLGQGTHAEAFGRVASFKTKEGQIYASTSNQTLGVSGTLYGYDSDGYRQNNRNEQRNGTLNLRWAQDYGSLDLRFGVDRQDLRLPGARRIQPSIGLDEYATDPRGAQTPLDYANRDGARYGLTWLRRFGEAEFTVGVDRRDKTQLSYFDQSGFPSTRDDRLTLTSVTPRLRLPLALAGLRHSLVLGADLNSWDFNSRRADVPANLNQPGNHVFVTQETLGLYVQDTIDLTRSTLMTLGYRGERAKYSGDDLADSTSPACPFGCNAAAPVRETQREHAWEVGLRHALDARYVLFGRAGRSYRFVNAEEIYENDVNFLPQFQVLRPQHAITYETGAEWRTGGNSLRATLFRTNVTDEIHLDPFTTGVGNTNLPPSRRQGVELDGRWQATSKLRFNGGYAYTDAKFLEGTLAGSPFAIGTNMSVAGNTVPLVPRHKVNLGMSWDLLARTRLSAALTAASSQVMDNDEPDTLGVRIPAYHVVDLKLAQEFGWGRISAVVNNLFNEKYYTYAVRSAFVQPGGFTDRYAVYPLPGIAFGVTVEVRL